MDHFPGKGCINNINFRSLLCNTQNETEMSINLCDKLESNTILALHRILVLFSSLEIIIPSFFNAISNCFEFFPDEGGKLMNKKAINPTAHN